jgi:hypothetical protein
VRVALAVAAVLALALPACSSGREPQTAAQTTRPVTTAPTTTTTATTSTTSSGGGLVEGLAAIFGADEVGQCVDEIVESAPPTSGGETVAGVARDVERLRRLRFEKLPRPKYLTGRALDRRLEGWLEEYPDAEADADGRALIALGALPPGSDLKKLFGSALTSQVAGFYDPRNGELVVDGGEDPALSGMDRLILAHELDHALTDQALRLPHAVRGNEPVEGAEDAAVAASTLVEGDATLLMEAYAVDNLSFTDAVRAIVPALASERELAELPYYLRQGMVAPYEEGERFVCELYRRGGWRAVDRAYRRLPRSTAEILFPERYGRGARPVDPPDPLGPGPAWKHVDRQAFGAIDLLLLFEAPGDDEDRELNDARERAGSWAGGELHTWTRGKETAVALALVDRRGDGALCDSMKAWRAAAGVEAVVRCSIRQVRVGVAPDARTAARLASS